MKYILRCLVTGIFNILLMNQVSAQIQCAGITLTLDDSSARANLDIVNGLGDEKTIKAAVELPGNIALLRKTAEFGYNQSKEDFILALKTIQAGKKIEKDYFGLEQLKAKATEATAMLAYLQANKDALIARVCETLERYLPDDYKESIIIQILSGGHATGFTFEGEPNFYLASQRIGDDPAGMELIVVHELFHVIQASANPLKLEMIEAEKKKSITRGNAIAHLYNGYLEGGATFVADPSNYQGDGPTLTFFQEGKVRYIKNIRRQFIIFEAYLYQLYNDKDANEQDIYSAGFYDDGPLYFVGYYMAKELVKKYGSTYIKKLLTQHPTQFYMDYIKLCREDKKLICFSNKSEEIVKELVVD